MGIDTASRIGGHPTKDVKLSWKGRVRLSQCLDQPTTSKSGDRKLIMNSALLFMRIKCVIEASSDIKEYVTYEIAQQPVAR